MEDRRGMQQRDRAVTQQGAGAVASNSMCRRMFIRFDVTVTGGRPWRVRVTGKASEWEPGNAIPSELRGAATPHWLPGRRDSLMVAIYKRLAQYAVKLE